MTIVYRSSKGSNLTAAEVDGNFSDLNGRVVSLETNPPVAVGISNIAVSGSQVVFYLSNGTSFGPYRLPIATFVPRGNWTAATVYYAMDLVTVPADGVYLVLSDHTSAGSFDAAASNSEGAIYSLIFSSINPVPIATISGTAYTPGPAEANKYFRCTNPAGCLITLQSDFQTNDELHFRQASSGAVSFQVGDTGGQINSVAGYDDSTSAQGSVVTLKYLGDGTWDIFGLLAAATA